MFNGIEFNGIEVDVISLGDADSIVVTQWASDFAHRILIDGGSGAHAEIVANFLLSRNYRHFWAAVCTHGHNDHARGLIKIVRNPAFIFHNAWMHDIRKHVYPDVLRRAAASNDDVKEIVETTQQLADAFSSRGLSPQEPFAGAAIAGYPNMIVLGPTMNYYKEVIGNFAKAGLPNRSLPPLHPPVMPSGLSRLRPRLQSLVSPIPSAGPLPLALPSGLSRLAVPLSSVAPPPLTGVLRKSSVQVNPATQVFNNTSVILGATLGQHKLMFTGDAGSEALAQASDQWNHLTYLGVPHHASDGNLSQRDIERFCPKFAFISAKGDSSHPSRAIVSGLVKVGASVHSTHKSGNLWFWCGVVPARDDYEPAEALRGTGEPEPIFNRLSRGIGSGY
jgi:beta-lactamase superfamily II metal-dependent hydrolase